MKEIFANLLSVEAERTKREQYVVDGEVPDMKVYALLRRDWSLE